MTRPRQPTARSEPDPCHSQLGRACSGHFTGHRQGPALAQHAPTAGGTPAFAHPIHWGWIVCALVLAAGCFGDDGGEAASPEGGVLDSGRRADSGASGAAASCRSDKECTPLGMLCHPTLGRCASCVVDRDCEPDARCDRGACREVVECANSLDCVGAPDDQSICNDGLGQCVQCVAPADCEAPLPGCDDNTCVAATAGPGPDGGGSSPADAGGGAGQAGSPGAVRDASVADSGPMDAGLRLDAGVDGGSEAELDAGTEAGADASVGGDASMSGGENSPDCPAEQPTDFSACGGIFLQCTYGDFFCTCSIFWACTNV